ncbi:Transposase DDE domain [Anaerobiospirillum thomasii]|nr:Transposase DDE domain [Anaerobiospirillum thomasii]
MIRGKRNMDGEIIDCHLNGVKEQSFIGLRLKDRLVGSYMKMDDMTLTVRLNNGLTVRVLRVWSRSKSDISFLITNIKNTTFTARELAAIQKIRWQVELFFKALKGGVNLRGIKTKIVDIIYSLIYVSFIVAMLKYLIFLAVDTGLQKGGKTMQSASFYKIFVSSMTYWTSYIKSLFSKGITKLQELLKSFLKLTHLYKMSPQSRKKQENLNTADSVIKMWEEGAYASAFDAQFTVC